MKYRRRDALKLVLGSAVLLSGQGCSDKRNRVGTEGSLNKTSDDGAGMEDTDLNEVMSREDIMALLDQRVLSIMRQSHHCAQTSFLALSEQFNLEDGTILKALTPMPGLGEKGGTCGAVTGGLMCLGLVFGRDRIDDWETYRQSLKPAGTFVDRFREIRGSIDCDDIVEHEFGKRYDLLDPEDHAEYVRRGATEKCSKVVQEAVRIAADIILREKYGK